MVLTLPTPLPHPGSRPLRQQEGTSRRGGVMWQKEGGRVGLVTGKGRERKEASSMSVFESEGTQMNVDQRRHDGGIQT